MQKTHNWFNWPNPSKEICLFMADIELGENNDKQKSDSWIKRSENFTDENAWYVKLLINLKKSGAVYQIQVILIFVLNTKTMIEN